MEERMDRVERNLETLAGHLGKLVAVVESMANSHALLLQTQQRLAEAQERLTESQQHTDERLDVLVKMMDEWIRSQGRTQ